MPRRPKLDTDCGYCGAADGGAADAVHRPNCPRPVDAAAAPGSAAAPRFTVDAYDDAALDALEAKGAGSALVAQALRAIEPEARPQVMAEANAESAALGTRWHLAVQGQVLAWRAGLFTGEHYSALALRMSTRKSAQRQAARIAKHTNNQI